MTATRVVHCLEKWATFVQTLDTNTHPKANKKPTFSFLTLLTVVLPLQKGAYPKSVHIVYCPVK